MTNIKMAKWLQNINIEKFKTQIFLMFCMLNIIRSLVLVVDYDIGFCNRLGDTITTNRGATVYYYNIQYYGESCDCSDNLGDECKNFSFLLILDIIFNSLTITLGIYKLCKKDELTEVFKLLIGSIQLISSLIIFLMFSRGEVYHFRQDQVDDDKTIQLMFLIISYINVVIKLNNKFGRELVSIKSRIWNLIISVVLFSISVSSLAFYKTDYCKATNKVLSFKSQIICHNGSIEVSQIENSWYKGLLLINLLLSLFDNSLIIYSLVTKRLTLVIESINPIIISILFIIVKMTYKFGHVTLRQEHSSQIGEIVDESEFKDSLVAIALIKVVSVLFELVYVSSWGDVGKADSNIIKSDNNSSINLN